MVDWSALTPVQTNPKDEAIVLEAHKRFKICEDWEAQARQYFEYDYKFANGDANNMYQWDSWVVGDRLTANRPCLTINKTQQHNLQIINDAKQNKPGVTIRPVGEEASFEAAQVYQEVIDHIQYISNAESVYDNATVFQVEAGIGYWRIITEPISNLSFDHEIYIRRIKDPRSVYLDPDINDVDGLDARFGFIFDDTPTDLYEAAYPEFKYVGGTGVLNNTADGWYSKNHVRVCEYYRKTQKKDTLVAFEDPETGEQVINHLSKLPKELKDYFKVLKGLEADVPEDTKTYRERKVLTDNIEWFKIAGNVIIDRGPWLGKYIPIVRLPGTETVIDGILDRKGHTRALLDPQRIYNINSSANVEFGALQTKVPWIAPAAAIEGYEEYYRTANTVNHSFMPWNHVDEDGNAIPAPSRPAAPQASPAYVQQMEIAQNEMMMVSGQFQAQMGENENAKSGVAINARQRQGDRATYHFIDNQAIAIRATGKILIDLIPKVYDTKRIIRIEAKDGSVMNVTIDPKAQQPFEKQTPQDGQPEMDNQQQIENIIFNPNVGIYDVQSDTGPSFATRRQEAFNALTQIAAQNKEFMGVAGDILWKVADFPEAQVLAQRWRKIIPKNITGDAPDPATEQIMEQASQHIQMLTGQLADMAKKVQDKEAELQIKRDRVALDASDTMLDNIRKDYEAISKRLTALGNSGPAISVEQIGPLIKQAVSEALKAGGPQADTPEEEAMLGVHEGGQPSGEDSLPGVPGSRLAPDNNHYVPDPDRPGKFLQVQDQEQQEPELENA